MTRYLSGSVQEEVTLDTERWQFYTDLAAKHGVPVRAVLTEVLRRFADLDPAHRPGPTVRPPVKEVKARHWSRTGRSLHDHREEVERLVGEGWTDSAIAAELEFSQTSVSRFRRLHLRIAAADRTARPGS